MESIPKNDILEYNPDTLESVRKELNLDKPGRIDEAIDILQEWLQKQSHLKKKDFSRVYLEITLISSKGLVERAKTRIDKLCTFKTLLPNFFDTVDVKKDLAVLNKYLYHAHLPKLTKDNIRVYFSKLTSDDMDSSLFFSYYKYVVIASEYLKKHDYCNGFHIVVDCSDVNIMAFVTKINIVELRHALTLFMDGYGMRLKGIHLLTPSKMVDALVAVLKQVLNEKLSKRVHVHKNVETLYEYIDKEILPSEYGGKERSLKKLNEDWIEILGSKEHVEYMKEMKEAKTDETYRPQDKFNDNCIGMPGSFRTLSVD